MKVNANSLPYDLEITKDFTLQNSARAVSDRIVNSNLHVLEGQTHNVSTKAHAPVIIDYFKSEQ